MRNVYYAVHYIVVRNVCTVHYIAVMLEDHTTSGTPSTELARLGATLADDPQPLLTDLVS